LGDRHILCMALLLLCSAEGGFAQTGHNQEWPVRPSGFGQTSHRYLSVEEQQSLNKEGAKANCLERKNEACTACAIDTAIDMSVKNKTKTAILMCRDMKPGPVKMVMLTRAEPTISGVWEVEFGLGYQTSTRAECPHQFIASDNPPLRNAYEIGPITIEAEIPPDGAIQALACVGLSSARVGGEGKDTGASLRIFKLRVVSE